MASLPSHVPGAPGSPAGAFRWGSFRALITPQVLSARSPLLELKTVYQADPIACAALAGGADVKAFFVRKEVKQHGLSRRIEGPLLDPTDRCMLVEGAPPEFVPGSAVGDVSPPVFLSGRQLPHDSRWSTTARRNCSGIWLGWRAARPRSLLPNYPSR